VRTGLGAGALVAISRLIGRSRETLNGCKRRPDGL
jgi:hypothetical protein